LRKIRVGIIGTGGIARGAHMPAYKRVEGVEMVAVCDKYPAVAQQAAAEFDVPHVFTRYRDLLAMDEIEAVSICTPNAYHAEQTIAALEAGKHVLVEKPMSVTAADGLAMVKAAKKTGKKLQVGLNNRFRPDAQALKAFIQAGKLGRIYAARALCTRRRGIPSWGVFTVKKESGGGPLLDLGVHILDLTLWLMGLPEPVSVSGVTFAEIGMRKPPKTGWQWDPKKFDVEDMAVALIRFKNRAVVMLESSWAANIPGGGEFNSILIGTEAGAQLSPLKIFGEYDGYIADIQPEVPRDEGTHYLSAKGFIEAIRKNKPVPIPGEEALITTRILDAVYKSAARGKEVPVP
jgi:predicted dehydrogenase